MSHLGTGVSDPLRLLLDAKQFLLFIDYRLHLCESAHDALEILPDVDAALSRLDQAIAQFPPDGERAASANLTRSVRRAPIASSGPLGRA
jgi:hypothetical protein